MPDYHRFCSDEYDAFVAHSALEAIAAKARQKAPNEMIGYLAGRPFRDARGAYAVVTEAIFAESARCGPVTVETSLDDEKKLLKTLGTEHPLAERLGWFHSHPFFMPTYSPTDLENQRFWSEPYQLGLLACLDGAGVSIFAFRSPEAEAIHPPYTASGGSRPIRIPPLRPALATEKREAPAVTAQPPGEVTRRRSGLALLTLALGVVWPIVYLIGVWMMVQAIREGKSSATKTVPTAPAGQEHHRASMEASSSIESGKSAEVGQTSDSEASTVGKQ
jgi:proteasome lid subunit RPN8/RPN11